MPYNAFKRGDKWKVYKVDNEGKPTGESLGEHPSKDAATRQIAAIEANEQRKERGDKDMQYDQSEVAYTTLSTTRGKACANCRFFYPHGGCLITEGEPLPILATGYCSEWRALPEPEDANEELLEILEAIENRMGQMHSPQMDMRERKTKGAQALFLSLIAALKGQKEQAPALSGFKSIGNHQWIGWYSNNFEDKEAEYFPVHAIDSYIARVDNKETPMPELRFWHVPYRLGEAHTVARIAASDEAIAPSFVVALGTYDDTPHAKALEKAAGKRAYKMSHGFMYPQNAKVKGVYHYYDTFEVSVLPPNAAANPFTMFGEETMPIVPDHKRKALVEAFGEELTKELEAQAETRLKELADKGVGYKDHIPAIDSEARAKLDSLQKSLDELTASVKAKMPMMDEDEDEKKKKADEDAYAAMRKEIDSKIEAMTAQMKTLTKAVVDYTDFTPSNARKSVDTRVPDDDPALQELKEKQGGEKSNEAKLFEAAFPTFKTGGA